MSYMEKLEDTKRVMRNRNSWKDRQYNGKGETKNKRTNNDLKKKQKIDQHERHL